LEIFPLVFFVDTGQCKLCKKKRNQSSITTVHSFDNISLSRTETSAKTIRNKNIVSYRFIIGIGSFFCGLYKILPAKAVDTLRRFFIETKGHKFILITTGTT
jgi:hypothetical protein